MLREGVGTQDEPDSGSAIDLRIDSQRYHWHGCIHADDEPGLPRGHLCVLSMRDCQHVYKASDCNTEQDQRPDRKAIVMDDCDKASEQEEMHLNAALLARKPVMAITGFCHNCFAEISGHFCDADCRMDWERHDAAKRRAGM